MASRWGCEGRISRARAIVIDISRLQKCNPDRNGIRAIDERWSFPGPSVEHFPAKVGTGFAKENAKFRDLRALSDLKPSDRTAPLAIKGVDATTHKVRLAAIGRGSDGVCPRAVRHAVLRCVAHRDDHGRLLAVPLASGAGSRRGVAATAPVHRRRRTRKSCGRGELDAASPQIKAPPRETHGQRACCLACAVRRCRYGIRRYGTCKITTVGRCDPADRPAVPTLPTSDCGAFEHRGHSLPAAPRALCRGSHTPPSRSRSPRCGKRAGPVPRAMAAHALTTFRTGTAGRTRRVETCR